MSLVVTGAVEVWTGTRRLTGVDLRIEAGTVAAVGPALVTAGDEVLDAGGCVVVPGLVNAHHHLFQSAFRTLPGTRHRPMVEWLPAMAAAYAAVGVDAEVAGAAAAVGAAEGLLAGVTTVADHHLTWPGGGDGLALAAATAAAVRAVGGRLVFVRGSAGDDPEQAAASADAVATALHRPGSTVTVAVGPAGVHSDGPETFRLLGEVAARHGLARRTQANEQVDVEVAAERYGRRPLDLLEDWGWLAPDVTVAHCCALTGGEIERIARSGAGVTHAPGCDLPMGWGVAPVAALADAGVPVGLGTSGGGSNDAGHLLADARLAMQVAPLAGRPLTALEVLTMATRGGADGLGRGDLGSLEPGAAADLAAYDVTGVADAGVADALAGLIWAGPGRRAHHVVVDGTVVVHRGALQRADEHRLAGELDRLLRSRRRARGGHQGG